MVDRTGAIYKVAGRRYVDSQAVLNLASAHEVVPLQRGWCVLVHGGAVRCALVEGRPELPGQRGALYELSGQGEVSLKAHRAAWLSQRLVEPRGTFDRWPGAPEAKTGCGCGQTCGCGPCRRRHAYPHAHEETP